MHRSSYLLPAFLFFFTAFAPSVEAFWTIQNWQIVKSSQKATMSAEAHFKVGNTAFAQRDWAEASRQFSIVAEAFPDSPLKKEALYFLAVSYFYLEECDLANEAFTRYIKLYGDPGFFESAVEFKYAMASQLSQGGKKRLFGMQYLPKWAPGDSLAIEIFDEVIATLPCHELAAKALFSKAELLWRMGDYAESVDTFQQLIRRFPKHALAPESYLAISRLYFEQSQQEIHNFDILALAQINLRKFEADFPSETRLSVAQSDVKGIKEVHARHLYETAQYYERKHHPDASILYYKRTIELFPETYRAELAEKRLATLKPPCISSELGS